MDISVIHIPGKLNKIADFLSRDFTSSDGEWSLDTYTLNNLFSIFVTPEVDWFATRLNYKLPKFCAWGPDPMAWKLNTTNNPEDEQRPSRPADYRSPNLVCATAREPDRSTSTLCSKGQIVLGAQARGQAPITQQNDPAWMQDLREPLQAGGFSTHAADLYTASWRKGTVTSYTSGIKVAELS
uniref:Uncharacterized protein n=1 Tax=Strigamia maritima TaxID=126957 RepID=T1IQY5_STRMM